MKSLYPLAAKHLRAAGAMAKRSKEHGKIPTRKLKTKAKKSHASDMKESMRAHNYIIAERSGDTKGMKSHAKRHTPARQEKKQRVMTNVKTRRLVKERLSAQKWQ